MRKQRWRWTKLKPIECVGCGETVRVEHDYVHEWCCSGWECGCYGYPLNPAFCKKCFKKIYGRRGN